MSLTTIDDDVLVKILFRFDDPQTLGFSLPLTCHRLHRLLCGRDRSHFWVQKCLRDRILLPDTIAVERAIIEHPDFPWFQLWHKRPFGRQLLGPNLKDDEIRQITQFARIYEFDESPIVKNYEPARCYATSYHWGKRQMAIELKRFGLNDWLMDHVRPVIRVSEWNGARFDCASTYNFIVRLAESPKRKRKAQRYTRDTEQWNDDTWEHVEFVFKDYSAGARFLMISSKGKDRQFWAGLFGSKFTDAELRIDWPDHLPDDSAPAGSSKEPDDQVSVVEDCELNAKFSRIVRRPRLPMTMMTRGDPTGALIIVTGVDGEEATDSGVRYADEECKSNEMAMTRKIAMKYEKGAAVEWREGDE